MRVTTFARDRHKPYTGLQWLVATFLVWMWDPQYVGVNEGIWKDGAIGGAITFKFTNRFEPEGG